MSRREITQVDRRRDVRVVANGSVVVHGRETTRGRVTNISSGGMCVKPAGGEPPCGCGERVEVELHLDRAGSTWLRFRGRVVRDDERGTAVEFTAVPIDFATVIQDAVRSVLEGATVAHVLLVDANTERRVAFGALLRKAGKHTVEAATPLEAIAHLGGSPIPNWVVAITDTVPASIADELRQFLITSDAPPIHVVSLGVLSPTDALAWLVATRLGPSQA